MDGSPRSLSPRPSFPSMSGPLSTEASSCPLPLLVLLGKSARSQHTGVPGRCAAPAHHCRPGDLVGPRGVQRHPPPHVLDAEAAEERPPLADGRAALRPHPCPVSSFPANTSPRPVSGMERERKVSMRLHRGAPVNVSSSDLTGRQDTSRMSTSQVCTLHRHALRARRGRDAAGHGPLCVRAGLRAPRRVGRGCGRASFLPASPQPSFPSVKRGGTRRPLRLCSPLVQSLLRAVQRKGSSPGRAGTGSGAFSLLWPSSQPIPKPALEAWPSSGADLRCHACSHHTSVMGAHGLGGPLLTLVGQAVPTDCWRPLEGGLDKPVSVRVRVPVF